MSELPAIERYRRAVREGGGPSPWVTQAQQEKTLDDLFRRVVTVRKAGRRAMIGMDLDLTSLLAPARSAEVLAALSGRIPEIRILLPDQPAVEISRLVSIMQWLWQTPAGGDFLLPGYTTTAIEGYAVYFVAALEAKHAFTLTAADRDRLERWVNAAVFGSLRNGYWQRDLMADEIAPGFAKFIRTIDKLGGELVFLSNRSPEHRPASLSKLYQALASAGLSESGLFMFFGPGGSAFDAASKAKAVAMIEAGAPPAVYFGKLVNGELVYPKSDPAWVAGSILLATVDDRQENRHQVSEAALQSASYLQSIGEAPTTEVAVAAPGFSAELLVVDAQACISTFEY